MVSRRKHHTIIDGSKKGGYCRKECNVAGFNAFVTP